MNHHPTTPPQLTLLRERILIVARCIERYRTGQLGLRTVQAAFDHLIVIEPDHDVARTYQSDKERLIQGPPSALLQLSRDYEALADSPPSRVDPGDPTTEVRERSVLRSEFVDVYGFGRQAIEIYGQVTPPKHEEPMDTLASASTEPPSKTGPIAPLHLDPFNSDAWHGGPPSDRMRPDWSGAHVSIVGGDFDRTKGRTT